MIQMYITEVGLDPTSGHPMMILSDGEKKRILPIYIGLAEFNVLALIAAKLKSDRPLTHDLLLNVMNKLGYSVSHILINAMNKDTFIAGIVLVRTDEAERGGEESLVVDARPSDALAIALKTDSPILVAPDLAVDAYLMDEEEENEDKEAFRKFIDSVKPSDFNSYRAGN